jgi:hypothetical protein
MKRILRGQVELAMSAENEEFASRVRSAEAKEAFTAFIEKRPADFTKTRALATPK